MPSLRSSSSSPEATTPGPTAPGETMTPRESKPTAPRLKQAVNSTAKEGRAIAPADGGRGVANCRPVVASSGPTGCALDKAAPHRRGFATPPSRKKRPAQRSSGGDAPPELRSEVLCSGAPATCGPGACSQVPDQTRGRNITRLCSCRPVGSQHVEVAPWPISPIPHPSHSSGRWSGDALMP